MKGKIILTVLLCLNVAMAASQKFEVAELNLGPQCPGAADVYKDIVSYISRKTSLIPSDTLPKVDLSTDAIFNYGMLLLSCNLSPGSLDYFSLLRLRKYLMSGGFLFINNLSPAGEEFDDWVRRTANLLFPMENIRPVSEKHAVLRSFFLINKRGGRFSIGPILESVNYGTKSPIIYSRNDIISIWRKDSTGGYLYPCLPGGEDQREIGKRILLNIFIYSVTGTYKLDAVHQPYIIRKMRILNGGN